MQRARYLYSVILFMLSTALTVGCASTSKLDHPTPTGTWGYIIPDTPQGEAQGTLRVASQGDVYKGEMYIDLFDQTVPLEEVAFTDSSFTFKATLDANNQFIDITTRMTLSGNTMTGTVLAEGIGEMEIMATRSLSNDGM